MKYKIALASETFYSSNELKLSKNIQDFYPSVGFKVYKQGSGESGRRGWHGGRHNIPGVGLSATA